MTPALALLLLASITSAAPPPEGMKPAIDKRLPVFERFGIHTKAELERALREGSVDRDGRSYAWKLSWMKDAPGGLDAWSAIAAADPDDLEAVHQEAVMLYRLGMLDAALEKLDAAVLRPLTVRDDRGTPVKPGDVHAMACSLREKKGEFDRARTGCERALELGTTGGGAHRSLARIELREGNASAALDHARRATEASPEVESGWWLLGLAMSATGDRAGAEQSWRKALELEPSYTPAILALEGSRTVPELLQAELQDHHRDLADELSKCGHYYLDLGFPTRADECLAAADRLVPDRALSVRAAHRAETDLKGAIAESDAWLAGSRPDSLLITAAWLHHLDGNSTVARAYLEEALRLQPGNYMGHVNLGHVCHALGDEDCADRHFELAHGAPGGADYAQASVRFVLMLLPLAVAYLALRPRVVRMLERRKATAAR